MVGFTGSSPAGRTISEISYFYLYISISIYLYNSLINKKNPWFFYLSSTSFLFLLSQVPQYKLVKSFIEQLVINEMQLLFVSHQEQEAPNFITHLFEFIAQNNSYSYIQRAV